MSPCLGPMTEQRRNPEIPCAHHALKEVHLFLIHCEVEMKDLLFSIDIYQRMWSRCEALRHSQATPLRNFGHAGLTRSGSRVWVWRDSLEGATLT